jgi:hypothetical protein
MRRPLIPPSVDRYDAAVDEAIATCGGAGIRKRKKFVALVQFIEHQQK